MAEYGVQVVIVDGRREEFQYIKKHGKDRSLEIRKEENIESTGSQNTPQM